MQYEIGGEIAQSVRFRLDPTTPLWASRGSILSLDEHTRWRLRIPGGAGAAVRRTLAGEGLSLTYIEADRPAQEVVLATNAPGHVAAWDLADGPVTATRGAFLAAWGEIDIEFAMARRAGAAFFGGAGLFLQRIRGKGTVLIQGSGDFLERRLAAGQRLLVSSGNLAAFADSVDYDIESTGGCLKMVFGGEGIFMTRLTGPGRVLLQSLKRGFGASQRGT
jgi:uncharacterized protein (TIGR00266 family)